MSLTTPPTGKTALIVLGMHRSGTSALAGVLGQLGVALPRDLMAPADMNAKGFFESNRITGLNERLLAQAGFTWWDPRRFPDDWFDSPEAQILLEEAVAALTDDYGDAPLFVIKDPRICRLMPFWTAALARFGAEIRVVHTHRGPWDVAASLLRWADYQTEFGLILWARHVLDAEADSRALPRSFTSYEALMDDWRATVAGIGRDLSLDWPRGPDEAASDIDDFLSRDLQHFRRAATTGPDGQDLPPIVRTIAGMLQEWVGGADPRQDSDQLDGLRRAMDSAGPLYEPLALRSVHQARQLRNLSEQLSKQQTLQRAEVARIQAERDQLVAQLRADLSRGADQIGLHEAAAAALSQRLEAVERRLHVASVQLGHFTEQRAREMQERLQLAIALDDPAAMSDRIGALTERVQQAIDALADQHQAAHAHYAHLTEELAQMTKARDDALEQGRHREAELLASTSWRVTAPLRAVARRLKR